MRDEIVIDAKEIHKNGKVKFSDDLSPGFLDLKTTDELQCGKPVQVKGEAYVVDKSLILTISVKTEVTLPCTICNSPVPVALKLENLYHVEPISHIRDGMYRLNPFLREAILLEAPAFAECREGNCPERGEISSYLVEEKEADRYHPFENLKIQE
jgi:uncharacterized metal-binding protein YceD (DUF177 family)